MHTIGGPSKRQPMNSPYQDASAQLSYVQTPKVIKLMYKNKIGKNNAPPPEYSTSMYIGINKQINKYTSVIIIVNVAELYSWW